MSNYRHIVNDKYFRFNVNKDEDISEPTSAKEATLTDAEREEFDYENTCRGILGLELMSEFEYLKIVTSQKQK
jgi:hypothetical protein